MSPASVLIDDPLLTWPHLVILPATGFPKQIGHILPRRSSSILRLLSAASSPMPANSSSSNDLESSSSCALASSSDDTYPCATENAENVGTRICRICGQCSELPSASSYHQLEYVLTCPGRQSARRKTASRLA